MELPLETERLTLRRAVQGDLNAVFAIYGSAENARYNPYQPWAVEHVEGYLTSQGTYEVGAPGIETMLCAEERTSRIVVGCVHFTIIGPDEGQAEIGYSFNSKFTGQGFATEAVVALMGFVFNSMGMHRICAGVDARNERSWKLMERVGMRREAHFVDANFEDGHWVDDYVYGMLKSEWIDRYAT